MRAIHVEECPDIGPICDVRAEPPQLHDQLIGSGELRLSAEYGFLSGWSATAMLPLRLVRTTIQFEDLNGTPIQLDYPNLHHRNETIFGPGDPWLTVQRGFQLEALKLILTARLGVTVPLGFTVPDPFVLAEEGQAHEHIQFGTGTFNPVLGLDLRREFHAPFDGALSAYGVAQLIPYANGYGYRGGNRYLAGVDVSGKAGRTQLLWRAGASLFHEAAESWASTPNPSEGNLGRTDVMLEAGVIWAFASDWTASLSVRVPIVTHSVGAQLSYPAIGELGASRLIHAHSGEEEEAHDAHEF